MFRRARDGLVYLTDELAYSWLSGVSRRSWMAIAGEAKTKIVVDYRTHEKDTGSPEVQIALLTKRINELNEHLKTH